MTVDAPAYGTCASCGGPARFLVTIRIYQPEAGDSGRILKYCQDCRDSKVQIIGTCIPLEVVERDRPAVMKLLYALGATLSDPQIAAEVLFDDPYQGWVPSAKRHLARFERIASGE